MAVHLEWINLNSNGKNQPFRRMDEAVNKLERPKPGFLLPEDHRHRTEPISSTIYSVEVNNFIFVFLSKKQAASGNFWVDTRLEHNKVPRTTST